MNVYRHAALPVIAALLLSACGGAPIPGANNSGPIQNSEPGTSLGPRQPSALRWDLQSSGEGAALVLLAGSGSTLMRLFCPAGQNRLLVNVPRFQPVASEERLSFGGSVDAVALVADTRGDPARGGVSGIGEVPEGLALMLSGAASASYGAQVSGPHPPVPAQLAQEFARSCEGAAPPVAPQPTPAATSAGACRVQEGRPVAANRLRAIGTEPFWGARIDGRCVTYSHPEDPAGTRVWTRFSGTANAGVWTGSLRGQPFVLRTRPEASCSDGMSDRRYPIGVSLAVGGEQRNGCAAAP